MVKSTSHRKAPARHELLIWLTACKPAAGCTCTCVPLVETLTYTHAHARLPSGTGCHRHLLVDVPHGWSRLHVLASCCCQVKGDNGPKLDG